MPVVTPVPKDLMGTPLYLQIAKDSINGNDCLSKINDFTAISESMSDLVIAGPFKNYTLHNRNHARKLIHLVQYIVPSEVITTLDPLECLLIIYAAHLHDLGLTLTSHERENIIASYEYLDHVREWPELWSRITQIRNQLEQLSTENSQNGGLRFILEAQLFQMQEAGICSMMRPRHANLERYRSLIEQITSSSGRTDLFQINGVSFADVLIQICISHNQDVSVLSEVKGVYEECFPRSIVLGGQTVNVQFCSTILRLTDILDFDRERTPRILFESLDIGTSTIPGAEVSLREWQKHMDIHSIDFRPDEIVVYANCTHPAIEKSIRDFCCIIERELRDTQAVLRHNSGEIQERYYLNLPITVRPHIVSKGYIFKDLSLQMNQAAITTLLMGEKMYSSPYVAIRELLQNSIDAISARLIISEQNNFLPQILIKAERDSNGHFWIEVEDNGIGMDEYVITEYLLILGNTYYDSPEFTRQVKALGHGKMFTPISRFGIGIISSFMLGDILEVHTRRFKSPRGDDMARIIRIERMGGLAFISETSQTDFGTKVRLRVKSDCGTPHEEIFNQLFKFLRENIIRPLYDIRVKLGDIDTTFTTYPYYSISDEGKNYLELNQLEAATIDLSRWSSSLSGRVIFIFSKTIDGKLSNYNFGKRLVLSHDQCGINLYPIKPGIIVHNYSGNRFTVNGFRMVFKKISRVGDLTTRALPAIFDVNVLGSPEVQYNVSRNKILNEGSRYVKNELKKCLLNGLIELGVLDKMEPTSRDYIIMILTSGITDYKLMSDIADYYLDIEEDILYKVQNKAQEVIASQGWTGSLPRIIEKDLGINKELALRAISKLLRLRRITIPKIYS